MTPLAHAAGKGFIGMVKLLVEEGANVNFLCSVGKKNKISQYTLLLPLIGYDATTCVLNNW